MLHQAGLTSAASCYAADAKTPPPPLIQRVLERERSLKTWCRSEKNSSGIDYLALAALMESKAAFLLELHPRLPEFGIDLEEARIRVLDEVVRFLMSKVIISQLRAKIASCVARAKVCTSGLVFARELLLFDDLVPSARAAVLCHLTLFRKVYVFAIILIYIYFILGHLKYIIILELLDSFVFSYRITTTAFIFLTAFTRADGKCEQVSRRPLMHSS
jgi:hypothetical protein